MCSVHKTAIPESYRKFKNSLLFVGNWNVTECFTADGLFAEMHQLAVEAEAEYYPLFSMELFGWYRSAPRAAEWGKDTVEKIVWQKQKDKPQTMVFMQHYSCHHQPLQMALHTSHKS